MTQLSCKHNKRGIFFDRPGKGITRLCALILCLGLFCAFLPVTAMAEGETTGTVAGLNEGVPLRVRSKPVDGDVVDQLYNGDAGPSSRNPRTRPGIR